MLSQQFKKFSEHTQESFSVLLIASIVIGDRLSRSNCLKEILFGELSGNFQNSRFSEHSLKNLGTDSFWNCVDLR